MIWFAATAVCAMVQVLPGPNGSRADDVTVNSAYRATPAERALEQFISAFNARSLTEPRWARWYSIYGPVDADVTEESQPLHVKAWVKGRLTRAWLGIDLTLADSTLQAAPKIVVFDLSGALPPGVGKPVAPVPPDRIADSLRTYLGRLEAADLFSGTVIVGRNGKPIFSGAYGFANRESRTANTVGTLFNLASVGKTFTAVAVMQLAQQGKLQLSDTLGRYLPDYPYASVRGATIRELLLHQSGAGRSTENWIDDIHDDLPLSQLLPHTVAPPQFDHGTSLRYSNEGYILLGRIIEVASGQSYYDYMKAHVFDAAGLKNTGFYSYAARDVTIAQPYTGPARTWAVERNGRHGTPAGGAFSTAEDLHHFVSLLLEGRLLDAEYTKLMKETRVDAPPPFKATGIGMETSVSNQVRWIGKGGDGVGANADWMAFPDRGYTIVVLSNYEAAADVVTSVIRQMLIGS